MKPLFYEFKIDYGIDSVKSYAKSYFLPILNVVIYKQFRK